MFGMLDYRAHKLMQVLWLPFAILAKLSSFVIIAVTIIIAESTSYSTLVKIILAYVLFEIIGIIVFQVIWALAIWAFKRAFFWLIDVVPAHGASHEEAQAIALCGRRFELDKKFAYDIANWTPEDTYEYVSLMNWRARLFFGGKIRIRSQRTATELKRVFQESGKQPIEIGINGIVETRKQVPGGNVSWFEYAIVTQHFFNSIVGITLIVLVIGCAAISENQRSRGELFGQNHGDGAVKPPTHFSYMAGGQSIPVFSRSNWSCKYFTGRAVVLARADTKSKGYGFRRASTIRSRCDASTICS